MNAEKDGRSKGKDDKPTSERNPWDNPNIPERKVDGGLRNRRGASTLDEKGDPKSD